MAAQSIAAVCSTTAAAPAKRSARCGSMCKAAQDELLKIYRREYKRRFAWIRAGKISQEAFSAWSKKAQREKEKCENGKISQGEFAQWLKGT